MTENGKTTKKQSDTNNYINRKTIITIVSIFFFIVFLYMKNCCGINIFNLLKNLYMLKYLPKLEHNAGFGLIFIFGVLTSFHCIGMCGGIAISQCLKNSSDIKTSGGSKGWMLPSLLYNTGRIISYTLVGAIVGGLGQIISFKGVIKGIIPIVGGVFMIIMAINLLGIFPKLRKFNITVPSFFA